MTLLTSRLLPKTLANKRNDQVGSKEISTDKHTGERVRVGCIRCACVTNHEIMKSVEEVGWEEVAPDYDIHWGATYQIIKCCGCDTISFRILSSNSEEIGFNGEAIEHEELYPSRTEGRQPINDDHLLPSDLERIYKETISALNNKQPVLTGIGIRAIIETVCKEKNASGSELFTKINDLVSKGVLTREGADILHKLRVLGNRSAHEVKAHNPTELNLAMDVVEHLLQAVYILPFHSSRTFK